MWPSRFSKSIEMFRKVCLMMIFHCWMRDWLMNLDIPSSDLIPFSNLSETWFQCRLLSEQSIDVRWLSLSHSTTIRDMLLNRCLICNQYTHILNQDSDRIWLNRDLVVRTMEIECQRKNVFVFLEWNECERSVCRSELFESFESYPTEWIESCYSSDEFNGLFK